MPTIEDTSRETALRLARAAENVDEAERRAVIVSGHGGGFLVSDALMEAYENDVETQAVPQAPACQSSPCFTSMCSDDIIVEPPTLASVAPATAVVASPATVVTLTGTNFVAPMTATITAPPDAPITVSATVTSPTTATVTVPATALDTAGTVTISATTANGTTTTKSITVA